MVYFVSYSQISRDSPYTNIRERSRTVDTHKTSTSPETQLEYLHREIEHRLQGRDKAIQFYRKRHYAYQSAAVSIGAAITILSGLNLGYLPISVSVPLAPFLKDAVLILGAVSTVIAAFGAFFSPQQSWHLNAEVYAQLRTLQSKLEFRERDPEFKTQENQIAAEAFDEYHAILAEYNKRWQELRQKSK